MTVPTLDFDPDRPLHNRIDVVANAKLVSHLPSDHATTQIVGGVFDAGGRYMAASQCWRNARAASTLPPPPSAAALPAEHELPGRWLFGGVLYGHFGHFLCESTARLWALGADDLPFAGIAFIPKRPSPRLTAFVGDAALWLKHLGARGKHAASSAPVVFEELVVAPQGFGTGEMMAGTPEFRDHAARAFGRRIAPDGAERIYISRSRLYLKRGRYLGEEAIEERLGDEGYRIFHPQEHDIATQIAQYKAAHTIVSSDNSALHLAAFFARDSDRIAIIKRRPGAIVDDYLRQFRSFAGVTPTVIDALAPWHFQLGRRRNLNEVYTELDLPALGARLAEAGFVDQAAGWSTPDKQALESERRTIADRFGTELIEVRY